MKPNIKRNKLLCFIFLYSLSISESANSIYKPGKWQMQCAHLSPAEVEAGEKMWRKSLICLLPSLLKNVRTDSRGYTVLKRPKHGMKKLYCKTRYTWEEEERSWELNLVLEQGLEEEFWRATGVGWGDRSAREVGKKWGIEASFIQCSCSAIDNLSTDISLNYFYPEGGCFYWKWGGFLKLSLQI